MAVGLSEAVRHAIINTISGAIDGGSGPGYIQVRSGSRPANVAASATGTVLLTFTLNDPSYGSPAAGSAALDVDPALTATGAADGTATWARVYNSDNVAVLDCSVGLSGTDIVLNTTSILTGATVTITAGSLNMLG